MLRKFVWKQQISSNHKFRSILPECGAKDIENTSPTSSYASSNYYQYSLQQNYTQQFMVKNGAYISIFSLDSP